MSNWISYLEQYRSNKILYEKLASPSKGTSFGNAHVTGSDSLRLIQKLECAVLEAEDRLEHYVEPDLSPSEAAKQADEKLFLSYRYTYGMTMMETAYAMGVSRDTVYRIRRRILSRSFPFDSSCP